MCSPFSQKKILSTCAIRFQRHSNEVDYSDHEIRIISKLLPCCIEKGIQVVLYSCTIQLTPGLAPSKAEFLRRSV